MNQARSNILNRLRRNNEPKASNSSSIKKITPPSRSYSQQELETQLLEKLTENRIKTYKTNDSNWTDTLCQIAKEKNLHSWLLGQNLSFQEKAAGALGNISPDISITRYQQDYEILKRQLFSEVDAGLTQAQMAIADTGTLLIIPDQNEPRMISLIPPVHILLLDKKNMVPSFQSIADKPFWHSEQSPSRSMPTNIVFISSPSKTADIQQTLAYGAHGPKEVILLLHDGPF